MDKYGIESHKLIYHPDRVVDWLNKKNVYPLTVEVSPSGSCNHRCRFCAFDYLEYEPAFLDRELMLNNFQVMAAKGVKAVVLAGEGEPLLNKNTPEFIRKIRMLGMDVAMSSNGVMFTEAIGKAVLPSLTWVRFSVNAGTSKTHQLIHQGRSSDFNIILDNLASAVAIKREGQLSATIGVQLLLIPENVNEVVGMAKILREIGVDYFTVKPYSQHPKSLNRGEGVLNYDECLSIGEELQSMRTDSFEIIFRNHSIEKLACERSYSHCLGLPFWAYVDSKANVWSCLAYLGDLNFCYGSLKEQGFDSIWEGKQRQGVLDYVANMNVDFCRQLCRLDEINSYLDRLQNQKGHVNFI